MPIEIDVPQGTEEWIRLRLAHYTTSQADRVTTPTGKSSTQWEGYAGELLAEWATGEPYTDLEGIEAIDRGKYFEPEAFDFLELTTDLTPRTVGHVFADESRNIGSSPDGLVGDPGSILATVEIKCPLKAGKHLMWLFRGVCPREHWCQVQSEIWVAQAEYGYFMSYFPDLPPLLVRVDPDPKFQDALSVQVPEFVAKVDEGKERLRAMGVIAELDAEYERLAP